MPADTANPVAKPHAFPERYTHSRAIRYAYAGAVAYGNPIGVAQPGADTHARADSGSNPNPVR